MLQFFRKLWRAARQKWWVAAVVVFGAVIVVIGDINELWDFHEHISSVQKWFVPEYKAAIRLNGDPTNKDQNIGAKVAITENDSLYSSPSKCTWRLDQAEIENDDCGPLEVGLDVLSPPLDLS